MYLYKLDELAKTKARLEAGDASLQPALERLLTEADAALYAGPFSVMQKKLTPESGDKHDYMSVGPYWWPDPSQPDGLPYIRKDGEVNPDRHSDSTDSASLQNMTAAVTTLSLAFYFSGNSAYAEHARLLLRTWFLDPATRMNPNLNFGQAIPGRTAGRDIGIIDTHNWTTMLDAISLLEDSPAWGEADTHGLRQWFDAFLTWLLTSEHGQGEAKQHNNHGTWYDAQVARYALGAGKQDLAREILEHAKELRLAKHIEPDGRQPFELARTRSFSYSAMNLAGLFELASMGEAVGLDLWHSETPDGRGSLRRALDFLTPYIDPTLEWLWTELSTSDYRALLIPRLRQAARVYKEPRYLELASRVPDSNTDRAVLLHPG